MPIKGLTLEGTSVSDLPCTRQWKNGVFNCG